MYPHMTARENVEFFATLSGVPDPSEATHEPFAYLDCMDLADKRVGSFSTGMRQRVGIARAIVHQPTVLFLDEPTSGLDPSGVRQLRETIIDLNARRGMTVFMNTHLLSEVAEVCTTIGVLNHGELIYDDTIEATTARFPTASVSESYYLALPASFTIASGSSRVIHFDNSGAPDHFAVNDFSLYTTSVNAFDVTVEVSAANAAVETTSVQKDAGGAETAD